MNSKSTFLFLLIALVKTILNEELFDVLHSTTMKNSIIADPKLFTEEERKLVWTCHLDEFLRTTISVIDAVTDEIYSHPIQKSLCIDEARKDRPTIPCALVSDLVLDSGTTTAMAIVTYDDDSTASGANTQCSSQYGQLRMFSFDKETKNFTEIFSESSKPVLPDVTIPFNNIKSCNGPETKCNMGIVTQMVYVSQIHSLTFFAVMGIQGITTADGAIYEHLVFNVNLNKDSLIAKHESTPQYPLPASETDELDYRLATLLEEKANKFNSLSPYVYFLVAYGSTLNYLCQIAIQQDPLDLSYLLKIPIRTYTEYDDFRDYIKYFAAVYDKDYEHYTISLYKSIYYLRVNTLFEPQGDLLEPNDVFDIEPDVYGVMNLDDFFMVFTNKNKYYLTMKKEDYNAVAYNYTLVNYSLSYQMDYEPDERNYHNIAWILVRGVWFNNQLYAHAFRDGYGYDLEILKLKNRNCPFYTTDVFKFDFCQMACTSNANIFSEFGEPDDDSPNLICSANSTMIDECNAGGSQNETRIPVDTQLLYDPYQEECVDVEMCTYYPWIKCYEWEDEECQTWGCYPYHDCRNGDHRLYYYRELENMTYYSLCIEQCPSEHYLDEETNTCIPICGDLGFYDDAIDQRRCRCYDPDKEFDIIEKCKCTNDPETDLPRFPGGDEQCVGCPPDSVFKEFLYETDKNLTCLCNPSNEELQYDWATNKCRCPDLEDGTRRFVNHEEVECSECIECPVESFYISDGNCQCSKILYSEYDYLTNECVCRDGFVESLDCGSEFKWKCSKCPDSPSEGNPENYEYDMNPDYDGNYTDLVAKQLGECQRRNLESRTICGFNSRRELVADRDRRLNRKITSTGDLPITFYRNLEDEELTHSFCLGTCPEQTVYIYELNKCLCKEEYIYHKGECKYCPEGSERFNNTHCECPFEETYDYETNSCMIIEDQIRLYSYDAGLCPYSATDNIIWKSDSFKSPLGFWQCPFENNNICPGDRCYCPKNQEYHHHINECLCKVGYKKHPTDQNTCICDVESGYYQVYEGNDYQCQKCLCPRKLVDGNCMCPENLAFSWDEAKAASDSDYTGECTCPGVIDPVSRICRKCDTSLGFFNSESDTCGCFEGYDLEIVDEYSYSCVCNHGMRLFYREDDDEEGIKLTKCDCEADEIWNTESGKCEKCYDFELTITYPDDSVFFSGWINAEKKDRYTCGCDVNPDGSARNGWRYNKTTDYGQPHGQCYCQGWVNADGDCIPCDQKEGAYWNYDTLECDCSHGSSPWGRMFDMFTGLCVCDTNAGFFQLSTPADADVENLCYKCPDQTTQTDVFSALDKDRCVCEQNLSYIPETNQCDCLEGFRVRIDESHWECQFCNSNEIDGGNENTPENKPPNCNCDGKGNGKIYEEALNKCVCPEGKIPTQNGDCASCPAGTHINPLIAITPSTGSPYASYRIYANTRVPISVNWNLACLTDTETYPQRIFVYGDTLSVSDCGVGKVNINEKCVSCRNVNQALSRDGVTFIKQDYFELNGKCTRCGQGSFSILDDATNGRNECMCTNLGNKIWVKNASNGKPGNRCDSCPIGYIANPSNVCVICPYHSIQVLNSCQICPNGTVKDPSTNTCRACKNTEQTNFDFNNYKCEKCPENQIFFDGKCQRCHPNVKRYTKLFVYSDGTGECRYCEKLRTFEEATFTCVRCPDQGFVSINERNICQQCPINTYANEESNSCLTCEGDLVPNTERSACVDCPCGYDKDPGSQECKLIHTFPQQCELSLGEYLCNNSCMTCPSTTKLQPDIKGKVDVYIPGVECVDAVCTHSGNNNDLGNYYEYGRSCLPCDDLSYRNFNASEWDQKCRKSCDPAPVSMYDSILNVCVTCADPELPNFDINSSGLVHCVKECKSGYHPNPEKVCKTCLIFEGAASAAPFFVRSTGECVNTCPGGLVGDALFGICREASECPGNRCSVEQSFTSSDPVLQKHLVQVALEGNKDAIAQVANQLDASKEFAGQAWKNIANVPFSVTLSIIDNLIAQLSATQGTQTTTNARLLESRAEDADDTARNLQEKVENNQTNINNGFIEVDQTTKDNLYLTLENSIFYNATNGFPIGYEYDGNSFHFDIFNFVNSTPVLDDYSNPQCEQILMNKIGRSYLIGLRISFKENRTDNVFSESTEIFYFNIANQSRLNQSTQCPNANFTMTYNITRLNLDPKRIALYQSLGLNYKDINSPIFTDRCMPFLNTSHQTDIDFQSRQDFRPEYYFDCGSQCEIQSVEQYRAKCNCQQLRVQRIAVIDYSEFVYLKRYEISHSVLFCDIKYGLAFIVLFCLLGAFLILYIILCIFCTKRAVVRDYVQYSRENSTPLREDFDTYHDLQKYNHLIKNPTFGGRKRMSSFNNSMLNVVEQGNNQLARNCTVTHLKQDIDHDQMVGLEPVEICFQDKKKIRIDEYLEHEQKGFFNFFIENMLRQNIFISPFTTKSVYLRSPERLVKLFMFIHVIIFFNTFYYYEEVVARVNLYTPIDDKVRYLT